MLSYGPALRLGGIEVPSNLSRYMTFMIIFMLLFSSLASAISQLEPASNLAKFNKKKTASIKGSVVTAEAGLPLVSGTVSVNDQQITIENGYFQLENLSTGLHNIIIKGPFRKK